MNRYHMFWGGVKKKYKHALGDLIVVWLEKTIDDDNYLKNDILSKAQDFKHGRRRNVLMYTFGPLFRQGR